MERESSNWEEKRERRKDEVNQGNGCITVNEYYTSLHDLSCRNMV